MNEKIRDVKGRLKYSYEFCAPTINDILKTIFKDTKAESVELKKLLTIDETDCLDGKYNNDVKSINLGKLIADGYITNCPNVKLNENEKAKARIIIYFDNFEKCNKNLEYLNYTLEVKVVSHVDLWTLDDLECRPLKILGYIDNIIKNGKYDKIGRVEPLPTTYFSPCEEMIGYWASYKFYHEDKY